MLSDLLEKGSCRREVLEECDLAFNRFSCFICGNICDMNTSWTHNLATWWYVWVADLFNVKLFISEWYATLPGKVVHAVANPELHLREVRGLGTTQPLPRISLRLCIYYRPPDISGRGIEPPSSCHCVQRWNFKTLSWQLISLKKS